VVRSAVPEQFQDHQRSPALSEKPGGEFACRIVGELV